MRFPAGDEDFLKDVCKGRDQWGDEDASSGFKGTNDVDLVIFRAGFFVLGEEIGLWDVDEIVKRIEAVF